jgi:hypothetical protein
MHSISRGMHVMKGISGSTISICERTSWYKDTITEERYLCTFEFVTQVLLYLGKLEEQKELVHNTTFSIIVL